MPIAFKMLLLIFTIVTTKGDAQGDVRQMDTPEQCEATKALMIAKLAADPDVKAFAVACGVITAPTPAVKA